MPIEVDENEYAVMKQLSGFAQSALNNPKTRRQILEIQKVLNPDAAIPELDAAKPFNEAVSAVANEVKELKKSLEDDKAAREQATQKADFESK